MPVVNAPAPNFNLPNTKKQLISLESLRGQKVVLAFFPAAFTGVCEKELCIFQSQLTKLNDLDATVVGISVDAPFSNGAFAAKNDISFTLLSDYRREAVSAYDVELENFAGMIGYTAAQRAVFIVDGDGVLRYQWVAPNPGVEPDYDEIIDELG